MKIRHIMSDETVRDSLKGFVIPYNEQTEMIYQIIAESNLKYPNEIKDKTDDCEALEEED